MCRVLIIDDDPYFAETIKYILEDAGEAHADYATTYNDARELVRQSLEPNKPYDAFLIDLRLGPGKDGIEFMQELRSASPDTDAIIFTGLEDSAHGVRAYEAGAFRYLYKPFENEELLYLLKAVKQKRKEEQEHDWQRIFSGMMEEALRKTTFLEVANVIVKYALKLGFSRAHLFWVPTQEDANPENRMIGITCAGKDCIPNFSNPTNGFGLYPLKQWFNLNRTRGSHEVIFFGPDEFASIEKQAPRMNYRWPRGEIAMLPLWGSNRHLGELMLDHGQKEKKLSKHELSLLDFFARQVSIVLENSSLISREQRLVQETTIINQIGRQVTDRAAEETNLPKLFDEVREQVGLLMDVSNFVVVLFDPESGNLNISLSYENGIRHYHSQPHDGMGIEKSLVMRENNIFWPWDVLGHLQKNKIVLIGKIPISCIGVQLRVGKKVIGGIVVKIYEGKEEFSRRDYVLLSAVANQISGAIKLIQANETERRDAERLNVLRQVMMEMLRIAQENEDDMWLTALTFATAHFGTGFNRALLFLENDEHTLLIGKTGVGTNDPGMARCDWENDRKRGYQFDDFLAELRQKKIHFTDLHTLAQEMVFQPNQPNSIVRQAMQDGQRKIVQQDKVKEYLPREITNRVELGECAVLPIPSADRIIGAVIVDNKHNGRPLGEKMLDHLQTLLNYTGLVWETLRQQKKSNRLISANYTILSGATPDQLKTTLQEICETARTITEADWVIIYPLLEGTQIFDIQKISYAGNIQVPLERIVKAKPRKRGVSAHVLSEGEFVIRDVNSDEAVIGTNRLANHHFIQREGVEALIGIAIRDVLTNQNLGVLYLDYRKARDFNEQEIHHARSFSSLAAVAIVNSRRYGEQRHHERLTVALETAQIVNTEIDRDEMLFKVLENLTKIFPETAMCILTYDDDEKALRFVLATLKYYPMPRSKMYEKRIFPLDGPSIACKAARQSLREKRSVTINAKDVLAYPEYLKLISKNRSELCISLMGSQHELLGVLVLERATTHGFNGDDQELVETVARQLSMGMERALQGEQLAFKTTIAAMTSGVADIAHDINNAVGEIQGYTYLLKQYAQNNEQLVRYADKVEECARRLFEASPKSKQGKQGKLSILVDETIRKYAEPLARQRDIEVEFLLDARGEYIFANPTDLRRILQHLTRNADKAMSGMDKKKITISTRRSEEMVEILFKDDGAGVSEEMQSLIFRKNVTTKSSGGFGLLLIRQFVEDMGGSIRLLPSVPGQGATFCIKLPMTKFQDANQE
jgi:signal transduction histidine kinase/DNA-binding NarL/FixJ family response regulator